MMNQPRHKNNWFMKRSFFVFACTLFWFTASAQEKVSLEEVITLALTKNYDVSLARTNAIETATNNSYAWGGFLPQLSANGALVLNNSQQTLQFKDATRNNKGTAQSNNTSGSVQLVWTLFDGTKMFATRERIATIKDQGELLVKDQMTNTIASIITNYFDVVRQKQQLRAIREQMAVSEERVKLAEKKLDVGIGAKPELLQAKVDYNAQRTQALQQQSAIKQLKERLNGLVGSQLPSTFDVSDSIAIDLALREEDIMGNIDATNYTLQASRKNMRIANLALHERRGELFPILNFNAAYNYNRTNNIQLINPFSAVFSQSQGFNYGFSVSVPILNGFTTRRLIQVAQINVNRQKILYDQLETNVNVSLRNAFVNYNNAKAILEIEEENILLAKENVFIALETFKKGHTTFIELRTAQQSLADAYNLLITARYNAKVAETELLRLSGRLLQ
jgi:outer membrane protein